MARIRRAGIRGTLSSSLTDSATSLTEDEFADLPVVTGGDVLVLILDPTAQDGAPECVYVTAHADSSTTVTILRGQETSSGHSAARAHATGIRWAHGPTPADFAVDSVDGRQGDVSLTDLYDPAGAADAAAAASDPAGTADDAVAAHVADTDPHGDRAYADTLVAGIDAADVGAIATTAKGAANGVAELDGSGKIPSAQLPASAMEWKGVWNAATNTPTLIDGTGSPGDTYRVSVAGTRNLGSGSIVFDVGDMVIANDSTVWEKSDTTDSVASVFGRTGNVVAASGDYSAAQVSFTASGLLVVTGTTVQAALAAVDTALDARYDKTTADARYAKNADNLSALASASTARTNLGLGNVDNTSDATKSLLLANNQTGTSYTLVAGDAGKIIEANNAATVTITVPTDASVAFPIGTVIEVYQMGVGQVVVSGAGITFRAPHGAKTAVQYATLALWKRATDTWVVSGDTTT